MTPWRPTTTRARLWPPRSSLQTSAQKSTQLADLRFQGGVTTYLEVLIQRAELVQRRVAVRAPASCKPGSRWCSSIKPWAAAGNPRTTALPLQGESTRSARLRTSAQGLRRIPWTTSEDALFPSLCAPPSR